MKRPLLPPPFEARAVTGAESAFAIACEEARGTAGDGTLFWHQREDRLDCAVVTEPEGPEAHNLTLAVVALVGLGDALGALVQPTVPVMFAWPDRLLVDGAIAGGVRVHWVAGTGKIVLGIEVAIRGGADPGRDPDRTTLHDEGCGDIEMMDLLEAFGRHFLSWVHRWLNEGFEPASLSWQARAYRKGAPMAMTSGGETYAGAFAGLDATGGLIIETKAGRVTLPLEAALRQPTWI
jgi:BirA family transcriptional regulator, biotin operon repressor / biotin---[acetyl-CoA-carboxylase] ligase